jgi:hypothetical protein
MLAARLATVARRASAHTSRATSSSACSSSRASSASATLASASRARGSTVRAAASTSSPDDGDAAKSSTGDSWVVVGCDSDAGGALCVISGGSVGVVRAVRVVDNPTSKVLVNGRERVRLDPEAMRETARSLGVPRGTRVYLEEGGVEFGFSAQTAFVQGYNFGLWRGVLAAEEFDVRVVKPQAWKAALGLKFKGSTKDDSIAMARSLFPEIAGELKRKKDHGRAESLLIAAYGHVADGAAAAAEEDELCARVRAALTDRGLVREEGGALPYFGPYFGMTGDELRKELKARGCKVSGKKEELILRLETNDAESAEKTSATA